jgi:hypothetical protein
VRARLPCVCRICSAYTNGYLHTSRCVYTARRIGTAYPAPNPGRDKDKALYCRPIACGRRLSVYVCPPCNRTPATGRCVAGKATTITPGPPSHGPSVGCRQEGRREVEGWPWGLGFSGRPCLAWVLFLFAVRSVDLCSTLSHALRALAHPRSRIASAVDLQELAAIKITRSYSHL